MKFVDSKVEYIDHMGSDLTVVNAARVSFDKESDWEYDVVETSVEDEFGRFTGEVRRENQYGSQRLSDRDAKLINYLASHNHWTPFGHCQVQFRIKAPIFVARQLVKHQIGLVWNEVSRRYVDTPPEYYWPDVWRSKPVNAKQGSGTEAVDLRRLNLLGESINPIDGESNLHHTIMSALETIDTAYAAMIKAGVAPEQARMILPLNCMTDWYWTGSLAAWARVANLRIYPTAQQETKDVAEKIDEYMETLFPVSWKSLVKHTKSD